MPANEAILDKFLTNPQNTHRAVVANSVGMAVLVLKKNYLKDTDTEADISKKYERSIEEIKVAAKDKLERKQAVDFLISKAQEPLNKNDDAHLYLPAGNTYAKKTYTFPLNQVIPLVWLALKDHDKFAHEINYPGTKEQQFARARGEYKMRLDNFFNLLIGFQKENLCHQGIRNELVFLLNKIYFGIEVIEDDLSTIAATLKDHINTLFWQHYQKETPSQLKKSLTSALFTWMSEENPQPLFKLVDPENKVKAILETLFIRHGSDPVDMELEKLINNCLSTLNFNYDPNQYHVIQLIENIFNSAKENNSETIMRAFANIIAWIKSHIELEDAQNTANLMAYFTLYQAYKSLDKRMQTLLKATGNIQDSYFQLLTDCETYFTTIANANLENEFPSASAAILQIAQQLKLSIIDCKSHKMVDFIENFFAKWNVALKDGYENKNTTLKHLYRIFIDADFHEKVIMIDEEIDFFWNHVDTSTPFRDITVYQINRIFLHGIIKDPKDWSEKFGKLYIQVLKFVLSNFGNFGNTHLHQRLVETSYPISFISHLSALVQSFSLNGLSEPRMDPHIFLPHQAKNIAQWSQVAALVSEEKLLEIYQPQAVKINQMLYSAMTPYRDFNFDIILKMIPSPYRAAFLSEDRVYNLCQSDNPFLITDYMCAINSDVPEHERINVWKALSLKGFGYLTHEYVNACVISLPECDRLTYFILFFESKSDLHYMYTFNRYCHEWLLLPSADLLTYFKRFAPKQIVEWIATTPKEFRKKFDLSHKAELIEFVKPPLDIQLIDHLGESNIEKLKMLQQLSIIYHSADLEKLYVNQEYWRSIFEKIPLEKRMLFLTAFGYADYKILFRKLPHNHLKLIPVEDQLTYLKKLGADFLINQITKGTGTNNWINFKASLPVHQQSKIANLNSEFIRTFVKIYSALRAGQTSFFKFNSVSKFNTVESIIDYAFLHPNSRTAKALSLMIKFDNYQISNFQLLNEIHRYSYSKSGLFKRTAGLGGMHDWINNMNPNSRHSKIYNALKDTQQSPLWPVNR